MSDQPLPAPFNRDPATGLVDGVTYIRQPSGRISWKEMIDPAYIVFNRKLDEELTKIYGAASDKLVYADVIKEKSVEDKHILILLQGFVELAELRGYISAPVSIVHVTPGQNVTAQCHITWLPNCEEPYQKLSSGEGDATFENTGGFGYLAAVAGNRAFTRAVRRGLRIPILGFDEIAEKDNLMAEPSPNQSSKPLDPHMILAQQVEKSGTTFEKVKKGAIKSRDKFQSDPTTWTTFSDVPPLDCAVIIGLLKKSEAEKASQKTA